MKKLLLLLPIMAILFTGCEDNCEAEYNVFKRVDTSSVELPVTYSSNEVLLVLEDMTIDGDISYFSIIVKNGATLTVNGNINTNGSVVIDNGGVINVLGSLTVNTNIFFKGNPGIYIINVTIGVIAEEANAEGGITAFINYGLFESIQNMYGSGDIFLNQDSTLDDGENFEGKYTFLKKETLFCDQSEYSDDKLYKYERIN